MFISRRALLLLIPITIAAWAALVWYPIGSRPTRMAMVTLSLLILIQALAAVWPWRWMRVLFLAVLGLVTGFLLLPGKKEISRLELGQAYLEELRSFEGVPYVWGGENVRGIDCSGLVRRTWADTLLVHGIRHLDPALVRTAAYIWWHDLSARALRDQECGLTRRGLEARSVNELDPSLLSPGDLVATQDGVHIMAYLGKALWIEADPGADRVIVEQAPSSRNPWFVTPVVLLQWRELAVQ
ncbi:MAG: NlpC/P60 family protein [Verrucomicrobiota bacterium]